MDGEVQAVVIDNLSRVEEMKPKLAALHSNSNAFECHLASVGHHFNILHAMYNATTRKCIMAGAIEIKDVGETELFEFLEENPIVRQTYRHCACIAQKIIYEILNFESKFRVFIVDPDLQCDGVQNAAIH
ncbi:unnamed protein product [Caenorhabditis bovis]|uniref:Uncharacterized protein n=1 Tax=Caenorhabditis bovis TaxID=2654633 RepID=A0A8S1EFN6_9PELO|nr:unnamed protein product [Caenorhabditis bovis]